MTMQAITGVFKSQDQAENAVQQLKNLGIPDKRIGIVRPDSTPERLESGVPVSDTEEPGMGRAMGAAVGGAMGAAGGATAGLAVASLVVPGIGPLLAFGMVGAALLGTVGAAAGSAVGDQAENAADVMRKAGAEDLDVLRENWWDEMRESERTQYTGNFDEDEESYRRGYMAALHTRRRDRAYSDVEDELRTQYANTVLDRPFQSGYERGLNHRFRGVE